MVGVVVVAGDECGGGCQGGVWWVVVMKVVVGFVDGGWVRVGLEEETCL